MSVGVNNKYYTKAASIAFSTTKVKVNSEDDVVTALNHLIKS